MTWSQEEIDAFKARRAQGEGNLGKVDDFVCNEQTRSSPTRSSTARKWNPTPTEENRRVDEFIGAGSPMGKKRTWKVKSTKPVVPNL